MLKTRHIVFLLLVLFVSGYAFAEPDIDPYFDAESNAKEKENGDSVKTFTGSAPIKAKFYCTIKDQGDYSLQYEWRFWHDGGSIDEPYMIRYEEEPEVEFTQAGTDKIAFYAIFVNGVDTIKRQTEYWEANKEKILSITASESILTFPNAFSPNGDGANPTFKPIEYKSIIEFRASIFNRMGQKLYEWTDVAGDGWDGRYNGRDVREGVYYVLVNAKGSDGRRFNIKKSVTLLRNFDNSLIGSGDAPGTK